MVRIKKGTKARVVSLASFHNYYKNSGWELCDEVPAKDEPVSEFEDNIQESDEDEVSDSEWDEAMEDEVEKPLSEMNRSELEAKAASLGIDISGLTKNAQIREKIKSCI